MRELAIKLYLWGTGLVFSLFNVFPLVNKTVFLVSFPENPKMIYDEMLSTKINSKIIFLCHSRCAKTFKNTKGKVYAFESRNVFHGIIGLFHLATARYVIMDNYYGCLSAISFRKEVKRVQVWHAAGAIKRFGLRNPRNIERTSLALIRFQQVYNNFGKIVVGSEAMASIFKDAFKTADFLRTGVPRTDFFFHKNAAAAIRQRLEAKEPLFAQKKVILYAPTFRESKNQLESLPIDIASMAKALNEDWVLVLKLHPSVSADRGLLEAYNGFVKDYSSYSSINELFLITDILITDYSSIPMEFSFLKKKMIFFAYDLNEYEKTSGFWEPYVSSVPGPVAYTTEEVIAAIKDPTVDLEAIEAFHRKWNTYSTGESSQKLLNYLFTEPSNK